MGGAGDAGGGGGGVAGGPTTSGGGGAVGDGEAGDGDRGDGERGDGDRGAGESGGGESGGAAGGAACTSALRVKRDSAPVTASLTHRSKSPVVVGVSSTKVPTSSGCTTPAMPECERLQTSFWRTRPT